MASTSFVVLVLGTFLVSAYAERNYRIWGGTEASKNDLPYVASVRLGGAHICGGTIIGSRSILTAAHCVMENENKVFPNRLTVRVGSTNQFSGGKLYYVSEIFVHPNYSKENNDIAVLILELPLEWSRSVALIEFANSSEHEPKSGDIVTVAGWGQRIVNGTSYKLHSMPFTIASEEVCSSALGEMDKSKICLSHDLKKGNCVGDAGNGAAYKNKVVGVSSFVVGACGSRYPDVFSRIFYYASWLKNVLA